MKDNTNIYSGVFFDSGLHMTWDFNPGSCVLPDGIEEGDEQIITLYANIHAQVVGCFACFIKNDKLGGKVYEQHNSDIPLHITLYTGVDANGQEVPPMEAVVATSRSPETDTGYSPLSSLHHWKGEWGFNKV